MSPNVGHNEATISVGVKCERLELSGSTYTLEQCCKLIIITRCHPVGPGIKLRVCVCSQQDNELFYNVTTENCINSV